MITYFVTSDFRDPVGAASLNGTKRSYMLALAEIFEHWYYMDRRRQFILQTEIILQFWSVVVGGLTCALVGYLVSYWQNRRKKLV